MKTILAATDYSKTSLNAVDYAINLAKFKQSKVVLFHAYHPPIITSDVPISYVDFEKMKLLN